MTLGLGVTLALTAIWLNIFSYFINFISSNIQKRSSSFGSQRLYLGKSGLWVLLRLELFCCKICLNLNSYVTFICVIFYYRPLSGICAVLDYVGYAYIVYTHDNLPQDQTGSKEETMGQKILKTYTSMQISRCRQDKTMVSDNFKRNLHHFNMKKVEHVQLFILKWKRIKYHFKNNYFKMIVYFSL